MRRSESFAYSHSNQSQVSRFFLLSRYYSMAVTASIGFIIFILVINRNDSPCPSGLRGKCGKNTMMDSHWGGSLRKGYFKGEDAISNKNTFSFAAVTDLDQLTRLEGGGSMFFSKLLSGHLVYDPAPNKYTIYFEPLRQLVSGHNEAGRGMELSELTLYQNRLLAFDDRTGSIFEILSQSETESVVVPRFVITEGDGDTDKGMKWEWATVKNGELYIGSTGKEYTAPNGSIKSTNNLWIAVINGRGEVKRVDWTDQYNYVRNQLGAGSPGYVIHEAVLWSKILKKWIFLPRRVSGKAYDKVNDERMGTNKLLLVNEHFTDSKLVEINMSQIDPLHGFSTAAFVPNSDERHIVAIRSVEEDCVDGDKSICKQRSYVVVFDVLTGKVLMDEVKIEDDLKFEGIEFVNIHSPLTNIY